MYIRLRVVCDKFNVTDCGVTLYECINGETKYECVKEEEFKVIENTCMLAAQAGNHNVEIDIKDSSLEYDDIVNALRTVGLDVDRYYDPTKIIVSWDYLLNV